MIDYCEKDKKVNGLAALFQGGDAIMDCPIADVVEVVHGRWIEQEDPIGEIFYTCSVCKDDFYIEMVGDVAKDLFLYTYCPSCGAKMDGHTEGRT